MDKKFRVNLDCRNFIGEKPCKYKRLCDNCDKYEQVENRILIIKLAALGDVLRTTCILPALNRKYKNKHVTWVTLDGADTLLRNCPDIDRVMKLSWECFLILKAEEFDLAICLDKDNRATALINEVKAKEKVGFGLSKWGTPCYLNQESEYAFRLGIDDKLKFKENKKTYQEIMLEACGLTTENITGYQFIPDDEGIKYGKAFLEKYGLKNKIKVGINTGAGTAFANKAWLPERFAELADWTKLEMGLEPILLGGPAEKELNQKIASFCDVEVSDTKGEHDLPQFAGLIGMLDVLVTSDSLAMHFGLAQKVPTVALFGSTCPKEIMLTAPGERLSAGMECQPCYRKSCDIKNNCMKSLTIEMVTEAVKKVLKGIG